MGFPTAGRLYIRLVANVNNAVIQSSNANNVSPAIPVRFVALALPSLRVTAVRRSAVDAARRHDRADHPDHQLGHRADAGGPEVALVASVSPDFNLGSSIVALYTLPVGDPGRVGRHRSRCGASMAPSVSTALLAAT